MTGPVFFIIFFLGRFFNTFRTQALFFARNCGILSLSAGLLPA